VAEPVRILRKEAPGPTQLAELAANWSNEPTLNVTTC
jgi:hypothetical protein